VVCRHHTQLSGVRRSTDTVSGAMRPSYRLGRPQHAAEPSPSKASRRRRPVLTRSLLSSGVCWGPETAAGNVCGGLGGGGGAPRPSLGALLTNEPGGVDGAHLWMALAGPLVVSGLSPLLLLLPHSLVEEGEPAPGVLSVSTPPRKRGGRPGRCDSVRPQTSNRQPKDGTGTGT
jgi:hypothetical protein